MGQDGMRPAESLGNCCPWRPANIQDTISPSLDSLNSSIPKLLHQPSPPIMTEGNSPMEPQPPRPPRLENVRDNDGQTTSQGNSRPERRSGPPYSQLSRWVNTLRGKVERRDEQLRKEEERSNAMEEHYQRQLAALRKQNSDLEGEVATIQKLLRTRTSELQDAQTYLTTTDPHSHADVVRLVEDVNNAIFHAAASIADSLKWDGVQTGVPIPTQERDRAIKEIDLSVIELLEHGNHSQDPTLVQIALQSSMTKMAEWLVSAWSMGFSEKEESTLSEVYRQIRATESPSVAGRWRSLTCQHLRSSGELSSSELLTQFTNRIRTILTLSGYRGSDEDVAAAVNDYKGKVTDVVGRCMRLRMAIGHEVVSCYFNVFLPKGGSGFDPKWMQDTYGEGECAQPREGDHTPSAVLCPVALGLQKEELIQGEGGSSKAEMTPTLRAKVVLQKTLEELGL